jgi:choline dehydrogenase-like flavoprotein
MNEPIKVQVLIIGSGAGGSTTACELAMSGLNVVVLEEGDSHQPNAYETGSTTQMERLYRNRGMTPIVGSVPIGYIEGRCLGGSTELTSGFWHRLPREFALRWQAQYDLNECTVEALEPHFAWAENLLHVQAHAPEWHPNTQVFQRGIDAMGWSAEEIPTISDAKTGEGSHKRQGMTANLIPLAQNAGAQFLTGCRVKLLLKHNRRITGVLAEIRREDGFTDLVRIDAEHVFVCAGPTETPCLLIQSGIKFHVGSTFQIHPMLKVSALFPEQINAQDSMMPLLQVKEFWPDICLGGAFFSVGHLALILSENWPQTQQAMKEYRNMASYYVAVRSTGKGLVRPSKFGHGKAKMTYELSDIDVRHLSQGLARITSLLLAAGAKEVYPAVYGLPSVKSEIDAIKWLDQPLPRSALSLTTVHAFSTCPIGERADRCAADSYGKVHGFENLYVNDASMLPDSPGINPQATIMAIARRNAMHFRQTNVDK